MITKAGHVQTPPQGSFSFPYGAAALTRELTTISSAKFPDDEKAKLATSIKDSFRKAYAEMGMPAALQERAKSGDISLYLSGGGFRGWGYLLMSQHRVRPYPIQIINGFRVDKREFMDTATMQHVAEERDVFRVSKRRASQVPAVAFLIHSLLDAIPMIKDIRFCQGGVREGFLFDSLDPETRGMDPLLAASAKYGAPSSAEIGELLFSALPGENDIGRSTPASFQLSLVRALANMMFVHRSLPKESRSLAALYSPISGQLAAAHGVSHSDRAILGLTLCHRWDADLPPPHDTLQTRLQSTLTPQEVFWCHYLGAVAKLVGDVYPAGQLTTPRLQFHARWAAGLGKKGLEQGVAMTVHLRGKDPMTAPDVLRPAIEYIEAVGKKKNRIGGRDHGFGVPVDVSIERDL